MREGWGGINLLLHLKTRRGRVLHYVTIIGELVLFRSYGILTESCTDYWSELKTLTRHQFKFHICINKPNRPPIILQ